LAKAGYDKYHSDLDRNAEAQKELWSSYTGYQPQKVQGSNALGDVMSGAVAGAQMDQAKAQQAQNSKLTDAMSNYYTAQSMAPGGGGIPAPAAAGPALQGGWPGMQPYGDYYKNQNSIG
jgi:hypothetical protein